MRNGKLWPLFVFLMAVIGLGPTRAEEAPTVCRLAFTAKVHYAPQILAFENGWFVEPGVEVRAVNLGMSAGIAAAEALVSGSADVAVMGDVPALIALAGKRDCVLVAAYGGGENMHSIVVSETSGIGKPADLVGKRLGVQFGSSTHGAVYLFLEKNGIDPDGVAIMNVPQGNLVEALISGSIDALAASEPSPILALQNAPGARRLAVLGGLDNDYPLLMVAVKDYADRHPEAIRALVRGVRKAVDFINENTDDAARQLAPVTGAPEDLEAESLGKLTWKVSLDDAVVESLEMTAAFLHKTGKLPSVPDVRAHSRPEFVE